MTTWERHNDLGWETLTVKKFSSGGTWTAWHGISDIPSIGGSLGTTDDLADGTLGTVGAGVGVGYVCGT